MAKFTTRLQSSITLSDQWEMALSEIMFPKTWLTIQKNGGAFTISCSEWSQEHNLPSIYSIDLQLASGYYESIQAVLNEMNNVVEKTIATNDVGKQIREWNWPTFRFNELNQRVYTTLQKNMSVKFSSSLSTKFGS
jgi:hypothetical protein